MKIVEELTRIEGEGRLVLWIDKDGIVRDVEVFIKEPRRFFERLIRGLHYSQVPDLVSRICGLCGVSYLLGSIRALESCLGLTVPIEAEVLRDIVHLSERIKSHVIHIAYMNIPVILGVESFIDIKRLYPQLFSQLSRALLVTSRLVKNVMGRFHNTPSIRLGGVYIDLDKLVDMREMLRDELAPLITSIFRWVVEHSVESSVVKDDLLTCTVSSRVYPGSSRRVIIGERVFDAAEFYENIVTKWMKPGDNSYRFKVNDRAFLVGPLARFNKYSEFLAGETKDLIRALGVPMRISDPRRSVLARLVEILDAVFRILHVIDDPRSEIHYNTRSDDENSNGYCYHVIEAPRGVLYQGFRLDDKGYVVDTNIVTPTAQNLELIEEFTRSLVKGLHLDYAVRIAREAIISFDPCTSCSVHVASLDSNVTSLTQTQGFRVS